MPEIVDTLSIDAVNLEDEPRHVSFIRYADGELAIVVDFDRFPSWRWVTSYMGKNTRVKIRES